MAQNRQISGTVVDVASEEPLAGVSVVVKGTTNGTITGMDGEFTINVPASAILEISYIGYVKQEVSVGNQSQFRITLKEDATLIDEVVVVGYGTQKKSDITGSVTSVNK
jgi:hypothetical protein